MSDFTEKDLSTEFRNITENFVDKYEQYFYENQKLRSQLLRAEAAIGHLRESCKVVVEQNPCRAIPFENIAGTTCHCSTCLVQQALSATSGWGP